MDEKEKLAEHYDWCLNQIESIKNGIMDLEKIYFSATPLFNNLQEKFEILKEFSTRNELGLIERRTDNTSKLFKRFRQLQGYNPAEFHEIFDAIQRMEKNLGEEFFPTSIIKKMEVTLRNNLMENIKRSGVLPDQRFILVKADQTGFMVPGSGILWEKIVPARKNLKIQIKSFSEPNIFTFRNVFLRSYDQATKERRAILISDNDGDGPPNGYLVDEILGTIAFTKKSLDRKTEYMQITPGHYRAFVTLRGMRYYFIDDLNDGEI